MELGSCSDQIACFQILVSVVGHCLTISCTWTHTHQCLLKLSSVQTPLPGQKSPQAPGKCYTIYCECEGSRRAISKFKTCYMKHHFKEKHGQYQSKWNLKIIQCILYMCKISSIRAERWWKSKTSLKFRSTNHKMPQASPHAIAIHCDCRFKMSHSWPKSWPIAAVTDTLSQGPPEGGKPLREKPLELSWHSRKTYKYIYIYICILYISVLYIFVHIIYLILDSQRSQAVS